MPRLPSTEAPVDTGGFCFEPVPGSPRTEVEVDMAYSLRWLGDIHSSIHSRCFFLGHCSHRELFRRVRWPSRFDDLALARESGESVPPSRILRALHIAGCDRGNCEWFRFHCRDRTEACRSHWLMCAPAWG